MFDLILSAVLGWLGAAAVNYLSDVLPVERKIKSPVCQQCSTALNLPHYLLNRPCRECGSKPSTRHWIVLILGPVLAAGTSLSPAPSLGLYGGLVWLVFFGLVTVIDLEHRLILHPVSISGALLGLISGWLAHGLVNTILGGAAGFGIMLIFYLLGEVFIRILSRRRGEEIDEVALGFGDVNLSGVVGLLLGWPGVVGGLFLAILIGGLISGVFLFIQMTRKKYRAFQALPYGPFIVLSTLLLLFFSRFVR